MAGSTTDPLYDVANAQRALTAAFSTRWVVKTCRHFIVFWAIISVFLDEF